MLKLIGLTLFIIFLSIALIHAYWGIGGKWGSRAVLPTTERNELLFKPGLPACLLVSFSVLGFGLLVLVKSGIINVTMPLLIEKYALPTVTLVFLLRTAGDFKYVGLSKKVKNTQFAEMDKKYYTPLCLMITLMLSVILFYG